MVMNASIHCLQEDSMIQRCAPDLARGQHWGVWLLAGSVVPLGSRKYNAVSGVKGTLSSIGSHAPAHQALTGRLAWPC